MLINGSIRTVDLGLCQNNPFLLWAGVGFDAFLVHHLEPRSRLQKQFPVPQYMANLAWYAATWSGMNIQLWADGVTVSGTYVLALVTNVRLYAGGMAEISPGARIDDGSMDLWLFSGDSMLEILQHVVDLASGKHLTSKKTNHRQCREVLIKSSRDLFIQMDGEPKPPSKEVKIAIRPQSLRVLIPDQLPGNLFGSM
jgi:diacylglycerol kinase family enzyme